MKPNSQSWPLTRLRRTYPCASAAAIQLFYFCARTIFRRGFSTAREAGGGRVDKEIPNTKVQREPVIQARQSPCREQRMPPRSKEVLVCSHVAAQYLRKNTCDQHCRFAGVVMPVLFG